MVGKPKQETGDEALPSLLEKEADDACSLRKRNRPWEDGMAKGVSGRAPT